MEYRDILHADLNNFYASVETLLNPELKFVPMAVCGDPQKRHGIILAKNYLAKACNVKTGEPIWQAKQKCKDLVLVPTHYDQYVKFSQDVKKIYAEFTPNVESFGLDECWLDVTDCKRLWGSAIEIAYKIKERVKSELGLTISIGVSFSKTFAKLGSDLKKPDAVSVIDRNNYKEIAWPLNIAELLNVGGTTRTVLTELNIRTIGDLAVADPESLISKLGKAGEKLWQFANGENDDQVERIDLNREPNSIGHGTTTEVDIKTTRDAYSLICSLSEEIAFRLRKHELLATGVALTFRDSELKNFSKQGKLDVPSSNALDISRLAKELLNKYYDFSKNKPLRMITVTAIKLVHDENIALLEDLNSDKKEFNVEKKVDVLRQKYGYSVLTRGINVDTPFSSDSKNIDDDFIPFDKR